MSIPRQIENRERKIGALKHELKLLRAEKGKIKDALKQAQIERLVFSAALDLQ